VVCTASNLSWPTITLVSGQRCARFWRRRLTSAATCIFLRTALDYLPRRVDDDCRQELRWLDDRRDRAAARRDLAAWLAQWSGKYPKLTGWVEANIEETLTPACAGAGCFIGGRASTISISNRPTCWSD